jgi:hypothetical protein
MLLLAIVEIGSSESAVDEIDTGIPEPVLKPAPDPPDAIAVTVLPLKFELQNLPSNV